ncbi:DoxX family protein [Streptomyces iakyrus]|uniref:DoxX family protein n=1 Tax=Streptomyces iakyrus TaxID=68219 RepID=UPI0037FFCBCA
MTTVLAVTLSLVFLPLGLAKLAAVPSMRQAAAHLGMSVRLYRVVGALEVAGVAGLLLGLNAELHPAACAGTKGRAVSAPAATAAAGMRFLRKTGLLMIERVVSPVQDTHSGPVVAQR